MPSYKYEAGSKYKWYCTFYYTDYQGKKIKKKKMGFDTKKEADAWEREFLLSIAFNPEMSFSSLYQLYFEDMSHRLREHTMQHKDYVIRNKILPFFGEMSLNKITPVVVRKFQNELLKQDYKPTYLKSIHNQLTAIFNYAVRYHNLSENPCHKAGSIGKNNAEEMNIWIVEEFNAFSEQVKDDPAAYCGFHILFWCGLRIGELLALTWGDIDLESGILHITKSYQRIEKQDVITSPKTPKSIRDIGMTKDLIQVIRNYKEKIYSSSDNDLAFPYTKAFYEKTIIKGANKAQLPKIRVHDLRHSHASLLIELNINPVAISSRLGHENVQTTLNIYSHLYPNKDKETVQLLEEFTTTK